ncbi:MAG: DUF1269 domain-containing protein [Actinomycetales bacterium]|nr:DUF1269 domain-containing protein [Actinomycetales bacterium]
MPLGPVDVYVIGFPDNNFSGEIVPAILEQVDKGVIRVVDVLFVTKDDDGNVATLSIEDLGPEGAAFVEIDVLQAGALNEEDADEISDALENGSSALLIAYENTFMRDILMAFARANAVPIDHIRIPATVVNEVVAG